MQIAERTATWRRERRVLLRVSRAAWRLDQAERERSWALASARAEGVSFRTLAAAAGLSSSRVHQIVVAADLEELDAALGIRRGRIALVRALCLSYSGRMTATTISFRANEQTMAELRQLAGDGNLSDAIRELIHAQYTARLYAQAARDAERLRNDPADLAEIKAVNEELDKISAW